MFKAARPRGQPEPIGPGPTEPDRAEQMETLGVWERVDLGADKFQFVEGRGAPPPEQVHRRVTFFFNPEDFAREKLRGVVWEDHEGALIQDLVFRAGEADRIFLQ